MIIAIMVSIYVGFLTGQKITKKELAQDKAYFCFVDETKTKRCYEVTEDPYARQYQDKRRY